MCRHLPDSPVCLAFILKPTCWNGNAKPHALIAVWRHSRWVAAVPLGCCRPRTVFRVGFNCDGAATANHGDEFGEAMIRCRMLAPARKMP